MDLISVGSCIVAGLLYYGTLDAGFVYDDSRAVLANNDILPSTPLWRLLADDYWGTPLRHGGSHGSYRPLTVLSFRLSYLAAGGPRPFHFHLANVLLHAANTALVARLARQLFSGCSFGSRLPTAVTALLFAAHPVHAEAVAGVVGRADLAACFLMLLAVLCYGQHVRLRDGCNCTGVHDPPPKCKCFPAPTSGLRKKNKYRNATKFISAYFIGFIRRLDRLFRSSFLMLKCNYISIVGPQRNHAANQVSHSELCSAKRIKFRDKGRSKWVQSGKQQTDYGQQTCDRNMNVQGAGGKRVRFSVTSADVSLAEKLGRYVDMAVMSLSQKTLDSRDGEAQCRSHSRLSSSCNACAAFYRGEGFTKIRTSCFSCDSAPSLDSNVVSPTSGDSEGVTAVLRSPWGFLTACVFFSLCAGLCKETGVTALLICAVYDVALHMQCWRVVHGVRDIFSKRAPRGVATSVCCLVLALAVLLLLRVLVAGVRVPQFAAADNPAARCPSLLTRLLTFLYLPAANAWLLLCPRLLSFDWSMDAVPRVTSVFDPRLAPALLFYVSLYKAARRCLRIAPLPIVAMGQRARKVGQCPVCRHCVLDQHSALCRSTNNNNAIPVGAKCNCPGLPVLTTRKPRCREAVVVALAFLVIPFLPATNLFFYVGFVIAERVLYIPSVGYCLLVGLGCHVIALRTNRKSVIVCVLILFAVFSVRTIKRNGDWKDEESLYRSGIPVNPPKAYGNLGAVLSSQGRYVEAEKAFRLALQHRPNMADVHYNLGLLLQGRERYEEAMKSLQLAIQYRPNLAVAHLHLAQLLERQGRCLEAETQYRRCWETDGAKVRDPRSHEVARVQAMLHLGRLYAEQGRLHDALEAYQQAVRSRPIDYAPQSLYNLLGETLLRLRRYDQAEYWFQAALQAEPRHVPAHITYGSLLAMNKSRVSEAEQWFQRALQLAPDDPTVHHHFGQFLTTQQRHHEAALRYETAAELAPERLEFVLSAATTLRHAGLPQRAERFYRIAVQLRPKSARHHLNLGAILHLNGRYEEAASCYREALRLQPDDETALTNLSKLHSLMGAA